jgi:spore coat protein CotH
MSAEGIFISSPSTEQRLLTMYINQYNQTNTHIDTLLTMLDEIKANISKTNTITKPSNYFT